MLLPTVAFASLQKGVPQVPRKSALTRNPPPCWSCAWTVAGTGSLVVGLRACSGTALTDLRAAQRQLRRARHARRQFSVICRSDGGLATWRSSEVGQKGEIPVIWFPAEDLLLVGHTKQMHLYEPRWVDMVDSARRLYGGIFALVYMINDGRSLSLLRTATVVEVVACNNLGEAGRVLTVRAVARCSLQGFSKEISEESWGVARVNVIPETLKEDAQSASSAKRGLMALLENLDLTMPGSSRGSQPSGATAIGAEEKQPDGPRLWTHQRGSIEEDFTVQWTSLIAGVQSTLSGVPLNLEDGMPLETEQELMQGVATYYAALSRSDISVRIELFSDSKRSLTERVEDLSKRLEEKQGMARARRAIANALESTDADSTETPTSPVAKKVEAGPRDPKLGFLGHYEQPGAYAFRVGDVVVHRGHGQVGVVAERFRVCRMGEEWTAMNCPKGMTAWQPFYTILLILPNGEALTRHGAQSSHRRWDRTLDGGDPPDVQHPDMSQFFGEFDAVSARYQPLDEAAAAQEIVASEWDKGS